MNLKEPPYLQSSAMLGPCLVDEQHCDALGQPGDAGDVRVQGRGQPGRCRGHLVIAELKHDCQTLDAQVALGLHDRNVQGWELWVLLPATAVP